MLDRLRDTLARGVRALCTAAERHLPHVVYGRPGDGPYLTRTRLVYRGPGRVQLCLNHFHRSDGDDALHDHPCAALSLILLGGYVEERAEGPGPTRMHVRRPGRFNLLRTTTRHVVTLLDRDAWTLMLMAPDTQSWGFYDRATGAFTPWERQTSAPRDARE